MAMSDELLKQFEKIKALPYGTGFFKADLHFHTPASEDARGSNRYNFNPYKIAYPKKDSPNYQKAVKAVQEDILVQAQALAAKIVERFIEVELSVVAITDHNGIGTIWADHESDEGQMDLAAPTWYELIDDAAQQVNLKAGYTRLQILPGTEISTTGVHILAIFPPQNPRRKVHFMICDLLNEVGFAVDDFGRNPKVGHASVYDAIDLITKKGGVAIPAHIDGSDQSVLTLYDLTSGAMKDVLQNKNLRGVEIVDPGKFNKPNKDLKMTLKAWMDDLRREANLPALAFFQGSDAHDLPTISKRLTYLKMTSPSFSGLATALKMPSSRIRIADSFKPLNGLYLYGLVCDHPFLGPQTLHFNRNLNCVTGKRGAGKTTLSNLMQGVVDAAFPVREGKATLFVEQITEDVSRYYAYQRNAGENSISFYEIDPAAKKVTALDTEQAKKFAVVPRFYDPERMEQIIKDKAQLQAFLVKYFGNPTAENVKKFNELYSTPRFLDEQRDPLLVLATDKDGYRLALNLQWRTAKTALQDFFELSLSLRRTAMMCMIILGGQFGPVIVDAPEDEFDNEDMARFLVPVIKEQKDAHQIVLFTNNPILAVNTDPDNYLLMQLQGAKAKEIVSGFAIDAQEQKPLLLNILEGNLETFRKRANQYE